MAKIDRDTMRLSLADAIYNSGAVGCGCCTDFQMTDDQRELCTNRDADHIDGQSLYLADIALDVLKDRMEEFMSMVLTKHFNNDGVNNDW